MPKREKDLSRNDAYAGFYAHYPQAGKASRRLGFKKKLSRQGVLAAGLLLLILGIMHGDIGNAACRELILGWLKNDDALAIAEIWARDGADYLRNHAVAAGTAMTELPETDTKLPASGRIVSTFGWQRKTESFNKGIIIETDGIEEVRALYAGIVSAVKKEGEYYTIVIEGDDGLVSIYAHCSQAAVRERTTVAVGDIIGYSGNCLVEKGRVYLELTRYGEPIDPLKYGGVQQV